MRIGTVARHLHTTPDAIRFYEREGLIPSPPRNPSGYRHYTQTDVERLRCLVGFRHLDLTLAQAASLARLCVDTSDCEEMNAELARLVADKREEVGARIAELQFLDAELAMVQDDLDPQVAQIIQINRKGGAR